MSLYDGIELGSKEKKDDKDTGGWASGLKLLHTQIHLKKAAVTQVKRERTRAQQLPLGSPIVNSRGGKPGDLILPTSSPLSGINPVGLVDSDVALPPLSFITKDEHRFGTGSGKVILFGEIEVEDEYSPLYPNDYEKAVKRREESRIRQKAEDRAVRDSEERERRKRERFEMEEEREDVLDKRASFGAAIAPPPSLVEQDRKLLDQPASPTVSSRVNEVSGGPAKGLGVAAKIMERYGYRHGQGLGKDQQGMSTALQVEKVSKRGGKIIHERDYSKDTDESMSQPQESITDILKNPTKVVLLKNMVGPGGVDDDLETEVKEECGKYGEVIKCVVFEIPDAPEDEAVRIFVEFAKIEHAIKAIVDLNGRYFAGRMVRGAFYNLDKFRRFELGE